MEKAFWFFLIERLTSDRQNHKGWQRIVVNGINRVSFWQQWKLQLAVYNPEWQNLFKDVNICTAKN